MKIFPLIKKPATGGSGVVAWGPDFGTPGGDTIGVVGTLSMPDLAVVYDAMTCQGNLTELTYNTSSFSLRADVAVNDGPDNWTNPTNAQGAPDGTNATRVGQALAATDANLHLTYPNPSGGIETFTITDVTLTFTTRQSGTVLNNGGLVHEYRLAAAGAWTTLETIANDKAVDSTYNIFGAVGNSWANVNALEVRVRAVLGTATALVNITCDAVNATITANKTVVP